MVAIHSVYFGVIVQHVITCYNFHQLPTAFVKAAISKDVKELAVTSLGDEANEGRKMLPLGQV